MTNILLDLRSVPCPINFVKTKIKLDAMLSGQVLDVLLDDGEPAVSVSQSVVEEGHTLLEKAQTEDGAWLLRIQRS